MFSEEHDAYLFECTYLQARITSRMSEERQIDKVQNWQNEIEDCEEHISSQHLTDKQKRNTMTDTTATFKPVVYNRIADEKAKAAGGVWDSAKKHYTFPAVMADAAKSLSDTYNTDVVWVEISLKDGLSTTRCGFLEREDEVVHYSTLVGYPIFNYTTESSEYMSSVKMVPGVYLLHGELLKDRLSKGSVIRTKMTRLAIAEISSNKYTHSCEILEA
jgi:hypothetical protein